MTAPLVTVAIANRNGRAFVGDAVRSALAQDLRDLEVIVVDDASDDDSVEIVRREMRRDPRVRLERLSAPAGAGAARNVAIDLARGTWFAVLDHDDLMHPGRLDRLVARAQADGAAIIADDQLIFSEADPRRTRRLLRGGRAEAPTWLTAEAFLDETRLFHGASNLGYLKPVVQTAALRSQAGGYDAALTIGEDHDLLLRLLTAGLRCRIDPFLGYFYRKHADSISHRLTPEAMDRMSAACARFRQGLVDPSADLTRAAGRWAASVRTAQAFVASVEALKAGRPVDAIATLARRPQAVALFRMPAAAALGRTGSRLSWRRTAPPASDADVWIISRQRISGRTNGSSCYLIDLAEAVRRTGRRPHLVQPSPNVLGRWPALWLRREMDVFASVRCRGVVRLGPLIISPSPRVYAAAALGIAARVLGRLGLPSTWLNARRAPYAPAAPLSAEDRLYVARQVRRGARLLIADYAWQTEALPYALSPSARTAVVMHDLFHRRSERFGQALAEDDIRGVSRDDERRLLARADAIIAIQKDEAAEVARLVSGRTVLVAPMSARPAPGPQPGDPDRVLFVASNTFPNRTGLAWMLDEVWPLVRQARPTLELWVAGGIGRGQPPSAPAVRYLGFVDRLDRFYARAGLVVSPLLVGSGLKIKLVEALAHGKACVVTPVTLQGVEEEAGHAVAVARTPAAFAHEMVRLLSDERARSTLCEAALEVAQTTFSADRLHAPFVRWLAGASTDLTPPDDIQDERMARLAAAGRRLG